MRLPPHRCLLVTLLVLALGGPALAQSEATDPEANAKSGPPAPERPLIERTLILAPERAGGFSLARMNDYPGQPGMGVGVRYAHADFPDVLIDVFIYPLGDIPRDAALESLEAAMRGELEGVVESGRYSDLVFGDAVDIDLQRIDADGTLQAPRPGFVGATTELQIDEDSVKKDPEAAMVQTAAKVTASVEASTDPDIGRRLPIRLREGGTERQSVSFLFHRSLYAFKARVSAPVAVGPDTFDRVANHAMATIVPQIVLRSAGGCADSTIRMDPSLEKDVGAVVMVAHLAAIAVQSERKGCAATLDETVPDGHRAVAIDVSGIWERSAE